MDYKKYRLKLFKYIFVVFSVALAEFVCATPVQVAVIYPESRGSSSKVFDSILQGIREQQNIVISTRQVSKKTTIEDIDDWLFEVKAQAVISLGHRGYKLSKNIKSELPVTVGALVVSPGLHSGISLAGDPEEFLEYLKKLTPDVNRVFMVYSEKNSGWLIPLAKKAAASRNIELIAHEATNIQQGVKYYNQILDQVVSETDAIWIPLDRIVPDKAILPTILQAAWKRNIIVFSNNPLHAKKGTLFSLFPDHQEMGKSLARLAVKQYKTKGKPKVLPAKKLKIAVNVRTASHLGLHYSKSKQRQFDIVFPSR